jgi:hypothetical protein
MGRVIITAFVVVLGFGMAAVASETAKTVVASYLQIHGALAADKTDGVKPAAAAIAKEAAKMGDSGEALVKAAKAMESAGDLKAAREAFGPLSDAVIAAASADGWKDLSGLKIGYCSMVDRSWIQKNGTVKNPYYGSEMLTCGVLKDPGQDSKK